MGFLDKLLGSTSEAQVKKLMPMVKKINELEGSMEALTDKELRAKTDEFRARLNNGETEDELLPEVFAVVREAAKRTIGQRHYDVQLLGGIVLHQGRIAEMKTGAPSGMVLCGRGTFMAGCTLFRVSVRGTGCHGAMPETGVDPINIAAHIYLSLQEPTQT